MAEGIMKALVKKHRLDWTIDSAGTEYYHVGEAPDRRAVNTCRKFGIDITEQHARRVTAKDFETFDVIYALAIDVLDELKDIEPRGRHKADLKLLLDEMGTDEPCSVHDPYYGDEAGFGPVFHNIREACEQIIRKYGPKPSQP
jgi:protein-tyrosine phosphatase